MSAQGIDVYRELQQSTEARIVRLPGPKGFLNTEFGGAEWFANAVGASALFELGDGELPERTIVALAWFEPNTVIPVHDHASDYLSIVLEGEVTIGRTTHRAGSVRVVKAHTAYGPITVGPEGAREAVVFAQRSGLEARFIERTSEHGGAS